MLILYRRTDGSTYQKLYAMKQQSTKLLFWLALSFLAAGIIEGYLPNSGSGLGPLYLPHTVLIAVLTFAWCKSHARENNVVSPGSYPVLCAIFPPLGVPVYFFKFFGFRNGGTKVLKSFGFFIIVGASYIVPYSILKGINV